jgi:hypothetical protein
VKSRLRKSNVPASCIGGSASTRPVFEHLLLNEAGLADGVGCWEQEWRFASRKDLQRARLMYFQHSAVS